MRRGLSDIAQGVTLEVMGEGFSMGPLTEQMKEEVRQMIETTVPELPDDPTPEQCDAWIELSAILNDPSFIAKMRANASDAWGISPNCAEPLMKSGATMRIGISWIA